MPSPYRITPGPDSRTAPSPRISSRPGTIASAAEGMTRWITPQWSKNSDGLKPWGRCSAGPWPGHLAKFVNVVVQDEFTHDVIVRVAEAVFAAFDAT